ncbi:glycerol-3-phosphate dehydrogenase [Legionella clemsonensis]|uniref:Glycerol-3-phosphate dehydrogenase n=1 Tax=Legionella clemsonensis TaxID=1867846 RepID=A0A222P1H4_9GAMM|nr:glycerol-3-phosphate dehydrogenase [Legionella clemsonensis]ASQ45702.1 Aerobic glycerol-3-phosphate dehydrogenase [Legionella clemsonensis]
MEQVFDVAVIGGGINGCGAAADAALRGLSVVLLEQGDLASKTSSSSSKLIHGGLRYLEYYDFGLVKKALDERQRLLTLAPHLVRPQLFVLPYQQNMRPTWLLRTGLFFYDNLSRNNRLPKSKFIRRKQGPYFSPLKIQYDKGFLFYDCTTDDSRLTIANALLAKEHGATIYNYMKATKARVENGIWVLTAQTSQGEEKFFRAKAVINATGPWVESCNDLLGITNQCKLSLVKGSHLVVHKLYEGKHAYLLQHEDKRIVFIVPYQGYTMIGTTDVEFEGSLDEIHISNAEVDYLCALVNHYLRTPIQRGDIINTWSGVRPLLAAPGELKALSRDYTYLYTDSPAPAVAIYGGKITTYRQLASETINKLQAVFPYLKASQTAHAPLPGSRLKTMSYKDYVPYAKEKYFWLADDIRDRYLASYGTDTEKLLADSKKIADLGYDFGHGLYQIEVDYLCHEEWAQTCEDILWRRTKLGLNFSPQSRQSLTEYLLHKKK